MSALSLSVIPDNADTTTTTRLPCRCHCPAMAAIFCQRASEETLVPPNFRTIHGDGRNSFSVRKDM